MPKKKVVTVGETMDFLRKHRGDYDVTLNVPKHPNDLKVQPNFWKVTKKKKR